MSDATRDSELLRLRNLLEQARLERRTVTYLQAADALGVEPPRRIHKLARLVETLLEEDVAGGRIRGGLPAPGFFEHAARLGIFDGGDPARFHAELLASLLD